MFGLQPITIHKSFSPLSQQNTYNSAFRTPYPSNVIWKSPLNPSCSGKYSPCFAVPRNPDYDSNTEPSSKPKPARKTKPQPKTPKASQDDVEKSFPSTIPRKPRRGRRSEADACEDFVRNSLEHTFESIRQQNPEFFANKENLIKEKIDDDDDDDDEDSDSDEDENGEDGGKKKKTVVEEESRNWPVDADVGWGIRASEYFDKYQIKNVVGEDGFEIDWEGELEDNWVNEINCLEWESFAFHPSPLIVLVFERYKRASDNWKTLKELEKAAKVYRSAKDRLPPRTVKIDINIETDLAYALKAIETPQILFLRGNKIVYREKEFRTADELVQMIAYFYYNAKKPSCINDAALSRSPF